MDSLLKSDIFFFITGAMVLISGILVALVLFYLVRIIKDIKQISATVQKETQNIAQDVQDVRSAVKEEGIKAVAAFFTGKKKTTRSKKKKGE